ncbi:hypothetical protein BJX96DRAFT_125491 [Aspergillus floccosus]
MVDTPDADEDDRIDEATFMSNSNGDETRAWSTSVSSEMSAWTLLRVLDQPLNTTPQLHHIQDIPEFQYIYRRQNHVTL